MQWRLLRAIHEWLWTEHKVRCDIEDLRQVLLKRAYGEREVTVGKITIIKRARTSRFTVAQMSNWIEWLHKYCADNQIPTEDEYPEITNQ